jgi:hypothetical protein
LTTTVGFSTDEARLPGRGTVGRHRQPRCADLGGTELPLLLPGAEIAGVPVLDTTALHVAAILERLRGGA